MQSAWHKGPAPLSSQGEGGNGLEAPGENYLLTPPRKQLSSVYNTDSDQFIKKLGMSQAFIPFHRPSNEVVKSAHKMYLKDKLVSPRTWYLDDTRVQTPHS